MYTIQHKHICRWANDTVCLHHCTLTFHQFLYLMFNPVRSRWLWPATESVPPGPAHRTQHSEHLTLDTPDTVSTIITWKHHQERPYKHHLQHLHRETTELLQWKHHYASQSTVLQWMLSFYSSLIKSQISGVTLDCSQVMMHRNCHIF